MNEGCVPGGSGIGQLIPSRISMRVCCSSDSDRFGLQAHCPPMRVASGSETRHMGVLSGQSRMQKVIPNTRPTRGALDAERRFRHVPIGLRFVNEITPAAPNAPAEARRRSPNIKPPIMTPRTATLPPHDRRRTGDPLAFFQASCGIPIDGPSGLLIRCKRDIMAMTVSRPPPSQIWPLSRSFPTSMDSMVVTGRHGFTECRATPGSRRWQQKVAPCLPEWSVGQVMTCVLERR
jgi:hypothetical protein